MKKVYPTWSFFTSKSFVILIAMAMPFLFILSSCKQNTTEEEHTVENQLDELYFIIENPTDSCHYLYQEVINSIDTATLTKKEYCKYQLIKAKYAYKNGRPITNSMELQHTIKILDSMVDNYANKEEIHYLRIVAHFFFANSSDDILESFKEYLETNFIFETELATADLTANQKKLKGLTLINIADNLLNNYAFEAALEYYEKIPIPFSEIQYDNQYVINKMAEAYYGKQDYDKALHYYGELEKLGEDIYFRSNLLRVKASILLDKNETKEAYKIIQQGIEEANNEKSKQSFYYLLGRYYLVNNEIDSALVYFETKMTSTNVFVMENLAKIYQERGNREKANYYSKLLATHSIKEINQAPRRTKLINMTKEYEKLKADFFLNKTNTKHTQITITVSAVIIIILLVILFNHYILHQNNQKLNKEITDNQIKTTELQTKNDNLEFSTSFNNFTKTPFFVDLRNKIHNQNIAFKNVLDYHNMKLSYDEIEKISHLFENYFASLDTTTENLFPMLKKKEYIFLYLFLLSFTMSEIAVLTNVSYRTVQRYAQQLQSAAGGVDNWQEALLDIIKEQYIHNK